MFYPWLCVSGTFIKHYFCHIISNVVVYRNIFNYMYKNKEKEELLDIENVNTRSRGAPLFQTVIPNCEKYKNSALYHGAILWNVLPVNIRNIDSFDSFKAHQNKTMKENG